MSKGKRKIWLWSVIVLLLTGSCSLVLKRYYGDRDAKQVEAILSELRENGEPVTFDDFYALARKIPLAENGGPDLQQAALLVGGVPGGNVPFAMVALPAPGQPLSDAMRQDIDQWAGGNQNAIDLAIKAGQKKVIRMVAPVGNDWSSPPLIRFVQGRQLAQLLAADAVRNAEQKKPDESFQRLMAGLAMAEAYKHDPSLVSYMIGIAIQGLMAEALEWHLSEVELSEVQRTQLEDRIHSLVKPEMRKKMFQGERAMGLWAFQLARSGKWDTAFMGLNGMNRPRPLLASLESQGIAILSNVPRQELEYLQFMNAHVQSASLPMTQRHARFNQEMDAWMKNLETMRGVKRLSNHLLLTITPNMIKATTTADKNDTKLLLGGMAARVESHRQKNGKLPDALSDIGEDAGNRFADPWKPETSVLFKKLDDGFQLISVGPNGQEDPANKGDDVIFRVIRN